MDISSLDTSVVCSFSVYTVLFLVGVVNGPRTWLGIILFADVITGILWTFFPYNIIDIHSASTITPDVSACGFGRGQGAIFLSFALVVHAVRSSADKAVLSSFFLSSLVGCSSHLVTAIYNFCYHGDLWNANEYLVGTYGVALNMAGALICYWPLQGQLGHTPLPSRLNTMLRVNGGLLLLSGVVMLAFPEVLVKLNIGSAPYNALHLYYVRISAGYTVMYGVLQLLATGFLSEADKRGVVRAELVGVVISVLAILYASVTYEGWGNPVNVILYLLMKSVFLASAVLTLTAPPESEGQKQH